MDLRSVYPEFLTDVNALVCPKNRNDVRSELQEVVQEKARDWKVINFLVAQNYCYLGWAIHDEGDLACFLNAPDKKAGENVVFDGHTLYWLRDGVKECFTKDPGDPNESLCIQAEIPVAFDNPATHAHAPNGVNVLFLDGHVEFVKLPKDAAFRQALETIIQARRRG